MVDVDCVCGRRYTVPDDKAGKKLQCRRCGTVNRIPRPPAPGAVVIPFRDPGEGDDGEDDLLSLAAPAPPPLEIRDPLRRCPTCGFQDEASVVVCVRCGYDFRTGRRLEDAHEQRERSGRAHAAADASDELARLSGLAWLALTPLGVVLGPYLLTRGLALERGGRPTGRDAATLNRVRLLGASGLVLWVAALGALGVLVLRGGRDGDRIDRECRARLERVGAALRDRLAAERRFPPAGDDWSGALEALVGQGSHDLVCPLGGDLYPYRRRDTDVLTPQAEPDHLVLWEREPHLDLAGKLVLRALRVDGQVEVFAHRSELETATRRPAFAVGALPERTVVVAPAPAGERRPPRATATPVPPTGGPDRLQVALENFLAYAGSVDDSDPDFSQGVLVDPEFFTERVGVPPQELLPALLFGGGEGGAGHPDEAVRVQAARLLARIGLPRERCVQLARGALGDPSAEARLGAAVCLHRHGDDGWLAAMAAVVEDATADETRRLAVERIGREAVKGASEVRRLLEHAAVMRRKAGAAGADAMLPLPDAALEHVVALLPEAAVRHEAFATLYSAGEAGVKALLPVLAQEQPREVRVAAFAVLDRLRARGALALEEYLRLVGDELDVGVRVLALDGLAALTGEPPMPLLEWSLEALRQGAQGRLADTCKGVLARAGFGAAGRASLERMVLDLTREGERAPLLEALRAASRQGDERLDGLLISRWPRITDAAARIEVARLLAERPHEGAQRALLVAADDPVEDVRIEALRGLKDATALRGPELKREAARVIGQRLRAEASPRAMEQLLALAHTGTYCEVDGAARTHRCPVALSRAIEQLVRKGDRAATRALRAHPSEKTAEFLLSALDGARDEGVKQDIVVALQAITGLGLTSRDAAEWRKHLLPLTPGVAGHMAQLATGEALRQKQVQGRAEQRAEALKAAAAAAGAPR